MNDEQGAALKAACVQAAATLMAARHIHAGEPTSPDACANMAAVLYASVAAIKWETHAPAGEAIKQAQEAIHRRP
jgi:hypothetical protein